MNLGFKPYTKINSVWIRDMKARAKIIKLRKIRCKSPGLWGRQWFLKYDSKNISNTKKYILEKFGLLQI